VIIGMSIGLDRRERGWKLMPNWIALVEKSSNGDVGSPEKRARIADTLDWPDSD
jgi:hypothetical protein